MGLTWMISSKGALLCQHRLTVSLTLQLFTLKGSRYSVCLENKEQGTPEQQKDFHSFVVREFGMGGSIDKESA